MDVIEIPLRTTEEVLVVNPEDLKEDETFLLDLLTEERIPAGIYIKISVSYYFWYMVYPILGPMMV